MTRSCATFRFVLLCAFVIGVTGLTGCLAGEQQLRARAAVDLVCSNDLEVQEADATTRVISACNRRITYVNTCEAGDTWRQGCSWVQKGPMLATAHMAFRFDAPAGLLGDNGDRRAEVASGESSGGADSSDDGDDGDDE